MTPVYIDTPTPEYAVNFALGLFATLFIGQAHAFLIDAGHLRERAIVNRCVTALVGRAATSAEPEGLQAKIRKFYLGPIPVAEVTGREVAEGHLSPATGLTEVLPKRWRWFKFPNPLGSTLRDQRLLRLAVDLEDEGVTKHVRIYKGRAEIEDFLARQDRGASALDERLRPFMKPDFRIRRTVVGSLRLTALAAAGYLAVKVGGGPIAGLLFGTAGLYDAGGLFLRAKYALGKLVAPKGREPLDARTRRLDRGFVEISRSLAAEAIAPSARRHFGVTSFIPTELASVLDQARSIDDISDVELERLANIRHRLPNATSILTDHAIPLSTDYLFVPRSTPADSELVVVSRLGQRRSD